MTLYKRLARRIHGSRFKFVALGLQHFLAELAVFAIDWSARSRAGRALRNSTGLRLNLGCGPNTKVGWINVDLAPQADFRLDLRRPLPVQSESCTTVFAEHFLEHLEYPAGARAFFADCHRILQIGGRLLLSVPDSEEPLREYRSASESSYFQSDQVMKWHDTWCRTPLEHLNYHFRQNALNRPPHHPEYHHFAYDFQTLANALEEAGFTAIDLRSFDSDLDSEERRKGSLRVVALRS